MMALSKRTIISVLSALYLILLTVLAAYNLHTTRFHSLPVPTSLEAFILALPIISGLTITSLATLPRSRSLLLTNSKSTTTPQPTPTWQNIALLTLTILSTVLATLTSTHLPTSAAQTCELDTTWLQLFRTHNGKAIQRIQDAFDCCGLHSIVDKAFPFPSKNVGVDACSKTFGRTKSCFGEWRGVERRVAGLGLVVVVGVVVWEVAILLYFRSGGETWWSRISEEDGDTENHANGGRRVLSLGDTGDRGRYLDEPPEAIVEEEIDETQDGHDEDAALIHSRVHPSQLRDDTEQWASERPR